MFRLVLGGEVPDLNGQSISTGQKSHHDCPWIVAD